MYPSFHSKLNTTPLKGSMTLNRTSYSLPVDGATTATPTPAAAMSAPPSPHPPALIHEQVHSRAAAGADIGALNRVGTLNKSASSTKAHLMSGRGGKKKQTAKGKGANKKKATKSKKKPAAKKGTKKSGSKSTKTKGGKKKNTAKKGGKTKKTKTTTRRKK